MMMMMMMMMMMVMMMMTNIMMMVVVVVGDDGSGLHKNSKLMMVAKGPLSHAADARLSFTRSSLTASPGASDTRAHRPPHGHTLSIPDYSPHGRCRTKRPDPPLRTFSHISL
jgi:hypothetical protein